MPTDEEWEKAFGRLSRGESSLREEGGKLDVHHSVIGKRFIAWLDRETEKRQSICTQLKQNLDSLEEEYAKKKQIEEEKFRRATAKAEGEHKNRIADIQRATAKAEEVHRKRMSELDVEFVAKREKLQKATAKTEEEHKKRMSVLDTEISAKESLFSEFKKVGLNPTRGLELLKRDHDLDGAIAQKTEQLEDMEKKAAGLERRVGLANEQLAAWGYRFRSVQDEVAQEEAKLKNKQAEYRWATQNIQNKQAEMDTISSYINDMKDERAELEPKVDELKRVHGALVSVNELGLRAARMVQALKTLEDEVASLKRTRDELADVIRKLRGRRAKLEFITAQVVPNMVAVGGGR